MQRTDCYMRAAHELGPKVLVYGLCNHIDEVVSEVFARVAELGFVDSVDEVEGYKPHERVLKVNCSVAPWMRPQFDEVVNDVLDERQQAEAAAMSTPARTIDAVTSRDAHKDNVMHGRRTYRPRD